MALCPWCRERPLPPTRGARFCSKRCRQSAFRQRLAARVEEERVLPLELGAFEYADPPYPGMAWMYKDQPSYAGEVDHAALVSRLEGDLDAGRLLGFALSTSAKTLKPVLQLFRRDWPELRVVPWVKPINVSSSARGSVVRWEPLIVCGGRRVPPGFRDWGEDEPDGLRATCARLGGSDLNGRKPQRFCAWLFDQLGMVPGDTFVDTFPGSGIVSSAWRAVAARAATLPSPSAGARQLLGPLFEASP